MSNGKWKTIPALVLAVKCTFPALDNGTTSINDNGLARNVI